MKDAEVVGNAGIAEDAGVVGGIGRMLAVAVDIGGFASGAGVQNMQAGDDLTSEVACW